MDNTEKLLRALINTLGYEITEIEEQILPSGQIIMPNDYKLTKKKPLTITGKAQEIGGSYDFGQSVI